MAVVKVRPRPQLAAARRAQQISRKGHAKPLKKIHPSVQALRKIRQRQRNPNLIIEEAAFRRLVREIAGNIKGDLDFQSSAIEAMQVTAEACVIGVLERARLIANAANRHTVHATDMRHGDMLRG